MDLYLVELPVSNWQASVAWYRDQFGLPVLLLDHASRYALLDAGPARLALKEGRVEASNATVTFHVHNLEVALAHLATNRIEPSAPVKESPEGYRVAHVHDPDGHRLALFEWTRPTSLAAK